MRPRLTSVFSLYYSRKVNVKSIPFLMNLLNLGVNKKDFVIVERLLKDILNPHELKTFS